MQLTVDAPRAFGVPTYSVSVADIVRLALPIGATVAAGQSGLARSIFWARLLGSPHASLGAGGRGELVLLPGEAVAKPALSRLIGDLDDAGVEALVVGGEPHPVGLAAAEASGLPVVVLPAGASLPEAERAIVSLIVDREAQLRRKVEQIYERLLATLVDDAGVDVLTGTVAEVTGRPTIVLDEYFRVQVTAPADSARLRIGEALGSALAERDPRSGGRRATAPFTVAIEAGSAEALVVPLHLQGTPAGYLALIGEDMTDLDRQVADRAARVLGIEFAKQRAVTEAQLRLQGDFLDDLLSGDYPSEDAMLARGRWMGHDLSRPHLILAVAVDEVGADGTAAESRRMRVADLVRTELLRLAPDALLREQEGAITVALPRSSPADRHAAVELAEKIRGQLAALGIGRVTVGVGRSQSGVRGLTYACREAIQALVIARTLLRGGRTTHFEELGVQRLLFQLRDNPELATFYEDLLGHLQAHDARQGTELVNTLEAFFACHGNHVRTAQRLHLHRNTLLYRLDRARQVLGVELDDPETRLALHVALKIGRVIGRRPLDGPDLAAR
jgi:purine catabolism regulator